MIQRIPASRFRKIHFVGIGGAGMSGIAEVLCKNGFGVSGSDARASEVTEHLVSLGIEVMIGHSAENVAQADLVVYSSAVPQDNPELVTGRNRGIPVIRRAEMLGELMRLKYTIAVAGTHGKTTTTSMIGHIWNSLELSPTIIVGGIVHGLGSGAQSGEGDALIAEADEYDRSFLEMVPTVALITNVEEDHLDCYADFEDIRKAFVQFVNKVPFYGHVVACIDDRGVLEVLPELRKRLVTYGFSAQADYMARNLTFEGPRCRFDVAHRGELLGTVEIAIPGRHNVSNALGAIAVALEEGLPFAKVQQAMATFRGVRRRFEYRGDWRDVPLYDDYAHHPTEVEATLRAARDNFPTSRLVVAFQPHLFTRTRDQAEAFGGAFLNADLLLLAPIYPAREQPIEGVTAELVLNATRHRGHRNARLLGNLDEIRKTLVAELKPGDILVAMGAGDIWRLIPALLGEVG